MEKRKVYNGYNEHYLTGAEIKERFENKLEMHGRHHSTPIRWLRDSCHLKKLNDNTIYRVFITDEQTYKNTGFCKIMDNETDNNVTFFAWG